MRKAYASIDSFTRRRCTIFAIYVRCCSQSMNFFYALDENEAKMARFNLLDRERDQKGMRSVFRDP